MVDLILGMLKSPMGISIIVVALLIGLLFLVGVISLGGYIYHSVKKNSDMQQKCMKIFKPALIGWIILIVVNIVLIIILLAGNWAQILDFFLGKS